MTEHGIKRKINKAYLGFLHIQTPRCAALGENYGHEMAKPCITRMMRQILIFAVTILLINVSVAFSMEPIVTISSKWPELNLTTKDCGGFSDDSLILKIKDDGKEIKHEFCSSYGKAEAKIEQDIKGNNFLILKFGRGRGTNAISEYLSIFRVSNNLIEYATIPISEGAGPSSRWYYDYKIDKPKIGGLLIDLNLQIEGANAEWYPYEKKRTIQIR